MLYSPISGSIAMSKTLHSSCSSASRSPPRPSRSSEKIDYRNQRQDPRRSAEQLADHADHALPDGRARSPADRLAEPQGRRRMGDEADDRVGIHERPPRAVAVRQRRRHAASGWLNERFSAHIVSPVKDSLVGEVLAWTPSTNGTVTAEPSTSCRRPARRRRSWTVDRGSVTPRSRARSSWSAERGVRPGQPQTAGARRDDDSCAGSSIRTRRRGRVRGRRTRRRTWRAPAAGSARALTRAPSTRRVKRMILEERRRRPHQRCRPRSRADPRLPEQHLRHHQGAADGRAAQRGLRPHHAASSRTARPSSSSSTSSTGPTRRARRPTTRSPRFPAPTRPTKSSCSAATSIPGTRRPARPTTRSGAR